MRTRSVFRFFKLNTMKIGISLLAACTLLLAVSSCDGKGSAAKDSVAGENAAVTKDSVSDADEGTLLDLPVEKRLEIAKKYDNVWSFSEGLARVKLNGKWGFIDKSGKEIIPCIYDEAWSSSEGLACVELNGKRGFIDKSGKEIIPCIYGLADFFFEGLARVELNGKWGFIDKNGNEVIPCIYDFAYSFYEGLAGVKLNGKWGFIDKNGKVVVKTVYDKVYRLEYLGILIGVMEKDGEEVVRHYYDIDGTYLGR